MDKVYDKDLIDYIKTISQKVDDNNVNHIMKSKTEFVLYYYRKKELGGNYTVKLPIDTILTSYESFTSRK